MNNILVVLGVVCLQVVFGEFTESDLPPLHKECLKELNLPAEVVLSNYHEVYSVHRIIFLMMTEGVPDFNNIILCTFKKGNFLNADDTLNNVQFHNFLVHQFMKIAKINTDNAETSATNAINACSAVEGTDPGDVLVKNYNCIMKYLKNL